MYTCWPSFINETLVQRDLTLFAQTNAIRASFFWVKLYDRVEPTWRNSLSCLGECLVLTVLWIALLFSKNNLLSYRL